LDQEAIKVQPLSITRFSDGSPDIRKHLDDSQVVRDINHNLLKIPMFGCGGLECRDDPLDAPRIEPKRHIFEFRHFQEVDRRRPRPAWKQGELSVRMHVQNGRTEEITSNIEGFEGMSTLLRQRHHQGNIFPMKPHPSELAEVDAAREGQQSMNKRLHPPCR
jgi:hypothetical protein